MINPEQQRFPFCIVWTILPCITWLFPWIGHAGICGSNGIIYDFLGRHINVGSMTFATVKKYVRLYPDSQQIYDRAIQQSNQKFLNQNHNLCCNNCHHHVAHALNLMKYEGKQNWNQIDIGLMFLTSSQYVSWCDVLKVYLPCIIIAGVILTLVFTLR